MQLCENRCDKIMYENRNCRYWGTGTKL